MFCTPLVGPPPQKENGKGGAMFGYAKLIAGGVAVCAVIGTLAYWQGRSDGGSIAKTKQLTKSIEAYKDRIIIDDEIQNLSDYSICVDIGGLPDDCEQLRGLHAPAENQ